MRASYRQLLTAGETRLASGESRGVQLVVGNGGSYDLFDRKVHTIEALGILPSFGLKGIWSMSTRISKLDEASPDVDGLSWHCAICM